MKAELDRLQAAGSARQVPKGSQGVTEPPSDDDFARAAVWRVKLPECTDTSRNLLLLVHYVGEVARLYVDGKLLNDNFYSGNVLEIGLKRYAPDIYRKELLLKKLPPRKGAPTYLPGEAWLDFGSPESAVLLTGVDVIEQYEVRLQVK